MANYSVDLKFQVDVEEAFDELTNAEQEDFIKERLNKISDCDIADEIKNRGIYDYLDERLMIEQLEAYGYKVEKDE